MKRVVNLISSLCFILFPNIIAKGEDVVHNYAEWSMNETGGEAYTAPDASFVTYAVPADYPFIESIPRFNVSVNRAAYTGIYNDVNYWNGNVSFSYFDFKDGNSVEVEIACRSAISSFEILPASAQISNVTRTDRCIKFTISKANQNLTLVLNNNYQGDVLHLFCNDMMVAPEVANPNGYSYDRNKKIYYFGPGYYDLKTMFSEGKLRVSDAKSIYIAGGAVLNGQIGLSNATTGKIYGHGMIMNNYATVVMDVSSTTAGSVEGILVHGHRKSCWVSTMYRCSNVVMKNLKIISTRYASTDGMDITYCQDCSYENIFIRSCDDAIAIKGLADESATPASCPANKNLTFSKMQLWNDCNNAFGMGAETRASSYENIKLLNSDILYSYDDPNNHTKLDERSAMNICALQGTYFKDIVFENICVNRCERLIGMGFKPDFWFGSIQGDQTTEGGIQNVTFRNITCPNTSGSSIANEVWLYGWYKDGTPTKYVHDIYFDDVTIGGIPFAGEGNKYLKTNNTDNLKLVYDLHFDTSGTVINTGTKDIKIYPSVVNSNENIYIESSSPISWKLSDMQGVMVRKGVDSVIDTSNLATNIYLLYCINSENKSLLGKIIIK